MGRRTLAWPRHGVEPAFCGDLTGVHKTRSLRRRPPSEQVQKDLLESLRAKPWDPKRSREETDHFVFPPLGPRSASQGVQPLNADGSQLPTVEEELVEEVEHFHDMPPVSETRTSADVPVPEDADLDDMTDRLPDELFHLRRSRATVVHFTPASLATFFGVQA